MPKCEQCRKAVDESTQVVVAYNGINITGLKFPGLCSSCVKSNILLSLQHFADDDYFHVEKGVVAVGWERIMLLKEARRINGADVYAMLVGWLAGLGVLSLKPQGNYLLYYEGSSSDLSIGGNPCYFSSEIYATGFIKAYMYYFGFVQHSITKIAAVEAKNGEQQNKETVNAKVSEVRRRNGDRGSRRRG